MGLVVVVGINVLLDMGVNVIEVKVIDGEDVVVVELVVDKNDGTSTQCRLAFTR